MTEDMEIETKELVKAAVDPDHPIPPTVGCPRGKGRLEPDVIQAGVCIAVRRDFNIDRLLNMDSGDAGIGRGKRELGTNDPESWKDHIKTGNRYTSSRSNSSLVGEHP